MGFGSSPATSLPLSNGFRKLVTPHQLICGDAKTAGTLAITSEHGALTIDNTYYGVSPACRADYAANANQPLTIVRSDFTPEDWSSVTDIFLRYYLHPGTADTITDWRGLNAIDLLLMDNADKTRRYRFYMAQAIGSQPNLWARPGWHESCLNINDFTSSGEDADFSLTTIKKYYIDIYRRALSPFGTTQMAPIVTYDSLRFITNDKARIMWRFDDANTNHFPACGYLETLGMRATVGVITDQVGTSGKLTLDQLKRLQDAGHLIANHNTSYHDSHAGSLAYLENTSRMLAEYRKAVAWFHRNGFHKGARIFMAPGGRWNRDWDEAIAPEMDMVWLANVKWNNDYDTLTDTTPARTRYVFSSQAKTKYPGGTITDAMSTAGFQARLDSAITMKGLWCPYSHDYPCGGLANFRTVADYVKTKIDAGTLECITPYEYIRLT